MDETATYIKKCDKAPEIQALWKPEGGDFFASGNLTMFYAGEYYLTKDDQIYYDGKPVTWLPRQDQLQEMVAFENDTPFHTVAYLNSFIDGMRYNEINEYASMEQLWLAFVMKEKWNKRWNGEDWIT